MSSKTSPRTATPAPSVKIRALSVLPARREEIELHTGDGLTLVGELALPVDRAPVATLIALHPLPTQGGHMDSHVLRKAAWRLPALAGIAVLRFNTRGTTSARGRSEGRFDEGRGECFDVVAAIEYAVSRGLPHLWLVGWSFGTELVLMYGADPAVDGAILLSPPLRRATNVDLAKWDSFGKPLVALVPELDEYLRPDEARRRFASVRQAEVVAVEDAKHLWVGEQMVRRALDETVGRVLPGTGALPTAWGGTMVSAGSDEPDEDESDHMATPTGGAREGEG
jgi:alpha/beta superfamily hydrolase